VYEAARLAAIAADAPVIPDHWEDREEEFRTQMMEMMDTQMNSNEYFSTPREAHDSWWRKYEELGWVYNEIYNREKKHHPDMVPYEKLGQLEKDKDEVFIALCRIARRWIYDMEDQPQT
jgi:hypothetical protein